MQSITTEDDFWICFFASKNSKCAFICCWCLQYYGLLGWGVFFCLTSILDLSSLLIVALLYLRLRHLYGVVQKITAPRRNTRRGRNSVILWSVQ